MAPFWSVNCIKVTFLEGVTTFVSIKNDKGVKIGKGIKVVFYEVEISAKVKVVGLFLSEVGNYVEKVVVKTN